MTKQTAIRIPPDLAHEIEYVARIREVSVNSLIIEAVKIFLDNLAKDPEFSQRAKFLLSQEQEILKRLLSREN